MSDHVQTVSAIYAAFGKGDIPGIMAHLADDVRWEEFADNSAAKAGVPWLLPRKGKAQAGEFFEALSQNLKITEFQVLGLMSGGDQVAAELVVEAETRDGKRHRDEEVHLWSFDAQGKVTRFRHYVDTAKHIAMAR